MSQPPPQNMVQATGQVASNIVDGLKSQPSLLLILILNLGVFVLVAWGSYQNNERRNRREVLLIERCFPVTKGSSMIGPRLDGTAGGSVADRS